MLTTQTCIKLSSLPLFKKIPANAYLSHDLQLEMAILPREINPLNFHAAVSQGAEHGPSEVPPLIKATCKGSSNQSFSHWSAGLCADTQIFIFWVRFPSNVSVNAFQYMVLLVKKKKINLNLNLLFAVILKPYSSNFIIPIFNFD